MDRRLEFTRASRRQLLRQLSVLQIRYKRAIKFYRDNAGIGIFHGVSPKVVPMYERLLEAVNILLDEMATAHRA